MLAIRKNIFIALLIAVFSIQLGAVGTSAASELTPQGTPSDLSIMVTTVANERAFGSLVCNQGTDDIISFVLDRDFVNYSPEAQIVLPRTYLGSNATDLGQFDSDIGTWTGELN